jgi:hypothetical protein
LATVVPLNTIAEQLGAAIDLLRTLDAGGLVFARRSHAVGALVVLIGLSLAKLAVHLVSRGGRPQRLILPAVLAGFSSSRLIPLRHAALILALAGVPFFALALADPLLAVARSSVAYPGRRIALLIDASSSMMVPFKSERLRVADGNDAAFLTTVAAAETFVRQRKAGRYRDFIAVVEFGDEAYVITPFTTDYDNALVSISLIGDWNEYMRFPDGGTAIGRAIDQATSLFKVFDFLDAAGNAMVIFSDGEDTQVSARGKPLADVLAAARTARIPVYLVRTSSGKQLGDAVPDALWKPAVEATGGRFYAAARESDVLRAISDIDRRSEGTIETQRYTLRDPRFAPLALLAALLWGAALVLQLFTPWFTKFP